MGAETGGGIGGERTAVVTLPLSETTAVPQGLKPFLRRAYVGPEGPTPKGEDGEISSPLQATQDDGQEGKAPHATAACGAPEQSICSEIVTGRKALRLSA
jgi:hypothetical protein